LDVSRLVYLDETSINLAMTRLYGRSLKGERVVDYVPDARFKRLSLLSTIRINGEMIPFVYSGTLNGNLFMQYIWECVIPTLKSFDILILDCLSSHKIKGISEMVESVGANVVYLPQYSPDLNPIETVWSEVKADLKTLKARSVEALCDALTYALYSVTPEHIANHFENCYCRL
jgi:transposase